MEGEGRPNVESDQQLTTVTGQSVTRGDHGVRELNTFTTHCTERVTGMVSYYDHIFTVHIGHDKLCVYGEKGRLKRSVQIYCDEFKMISPLGMCLVQSETDKHSLVISDYNSQCLWWLTTEKHADDITIGQPYQHKLQYRPWGISADRSGRAVVADCDDSCVYVYSHPGQHVTCLKLLQDVYPYQVLTDQSDGYVIRGGVFQLSWVNSADQETRCYSDQSTVTVLPYHMVDDVHNNCVHLVTRDGRHGGHLITDIHSECVCLDPAGRRLWVAYKGKDGMRHVMEISYKPQSQVKSPESSGLTSSVCSA